MPRGQEHSVVQLGQDAFQRFVQGDEIDHETVFVQRAVYFGGHVIAVSVQPLALAGLQDEEVSGTEGQIVGGDADVEVGHRG